jgi:ribosome modulation factor
MTYNEEERKKFYVAGQHAYLDGFSHSMNPYSEAEPRQWWSSGWSNPRLLFEEYRSMQNSSGIEV